MVLIGVNQTRKAPRLTATAEYFRRSLRKKKPRSGAPTPQNQIRDIFHETEKLVTVCIQIKSESQIKLLQRDTDHASIALLAAFP
jgi:hypothetical protein